MGWRDLAKAVQDSERESEAGDVRDNGDKTPERGPIVPNATIVPTPIIPIDPRRVLREWHQHLNAMDSTRPPAGYSTMFWQRACDDACWIYEHYASYAVRDGWSALDLFGVMPWDVKLGGLVPRLAGARDLTIKDGRAVWSHFGRADWTCRGAGDALVASGIIPLWEMQ